MDVQQNHLVLLKTAGCSLLLGIVFYLLFRSPVLGLEPMVPLAAMPSQGLTTVSMGSFPSFIFMPLIISSTLLLLYWKKELSQKAVNQVTVSWLLIVVFFEICQGQQLPILSRGTFAVLDIIAAMLASFVTRFMISRYLVSNEASELTTTSTWKKSSLLLLGSFAILGSTYEDYYECDGDDINYLCVSEVVLELDDLRGDFQPDYSSGQILERTGKIYRLDQWLFVVEKFRGIHIFDMTDELNPIRQVYLPIPGALNLTIKDGVLYSSAFIDLVMIDLNSLLQNDGSELLVVRQEDVFQYPDERQFFPLGYFMDFGDKYNGIQSIVIGYKTKSGKVILYGDEYDFENEESKADKKDDKNEDDDVSIGCVLLIGVC